MLTDSTVVGRDLPNPTHHCRAVTWISVDLDALWEPAEDWTFDVHHCHGEGACSVVATRILSRDRHGADSDGKQISRLMGRNQ